MDSNFMAAAKEEIERKEKLQRRNYFILNELQNISRDSKGNFQQRLPYDTLSSLASSLLDGTVFDIVRNLEEIQQMTEKSLHEKRMKVLIAHKVARQEMAKKHKEVIQACQNRAHHLPLVKSSCEKEKVALEQRTEEETKRMDQRLILELDQRVSEQQVTLERAGVVGFYVTNNQQEVRLQMHLLDMINRLSKMELPEL